MAAPSEFGLLRSIGRWDLVAVVLNGVIGAGIFGLPSKVFALVGPYSLISFFACALAVFVIVLCFAEVAGRFTGTGGPYLFARETYGPLAGFTVGWLVWVARVTAFAANCSLLPEYLGFFFPSIATGVPRAIVLTVVIGTLTAVNVRGVRAVANTGNALTIGKLIPLVVFIGAGLFFLQADRFTLGAAPSYQAFSQSVLLLVFAFTGFEMAVIPAGEVRNPGRDLPPALMIGMTVVVTIYVLIQVVSIGTLPELAKSTRPLADAAARFLGNGGAVMITAGIVISLAGNLNVLILSASRMLYAMAEHGALPAPLAKVHEGFRTPAIAVIVTTAIMLALTISGTFSYLITISVLSRLVTYIATCVALPVLRRRADAPASTFKLPAGDAFAAAAVLLALWLISNSKLVEARDTSIAIAVGLTLYFANRYRANRVSARST